MFEKLKWQSQSFEDNIVCHSMSIEFDGISDNFQSNIISVDGIYQKALSSLIKKNNSSHR